MSTLLEAQFGFGVESTVGTRVAPTRFLPFLSESLKFDQKYLESGAYRNGRKTKTVRRPGGFSIAGDVVMELAPQGLGLWLKQGFGTNVDAGANPYTHTLTPGALVGKALSIQMGRVDTAGTMRPFDYTGCKITKWTIDAQINELAKLTCSVWGMDEDTSQSLATATYPTSLAPFSFVDASLTIAGSAVPVKTIQLTGDNGLMVDRQRIQAANPGLSKEGLEAAIRNYGGTLTADFTDLTAYNRFVNQTQATLVTTFDNGAAAKLVITQTVEFDGETPNATGLGNEVDQPLPFTAINATSDANVITAVLTNADSTA